MMMDKFTEKARGALAAASESAFLKNHIEVTPWHLLGALIDQDRLVASLPKAADAPMTLVEAGRIAPQYPAHAFTQSAVRRLCQ